MEKPGTRRRLTDNGIKQRRMAGVKHGLRAEIVSQADITKYRLERIDPELPELVATYIRAIGGDLSAPDLESAEALASKVIVRRRMVEEIAKRGVVLEEKLLNAEGEEVARRVRANPVLDGLRHLDEQLGFTADAQRITRKSHPRGASDDVIEARLVRDERIRAYGREMTEKGVKNWGLPEPDPDLFREAAARERGESSEEK